MRSPDRGSTTGAASWTDRERSERAARRASAASQSPPHRHILRRARTKVRAFFSHVAQPGGVRSPDRGSTTGAASWTDRERSERAARRASAASQSPPHRHIRERARTKVRAFFSYVAQPGGVRSPDRGSTTGAASWTDRERSERAARRASAASQSPPHRHILRRARTKVRAFFSHVAQPGGVRSPDRGSTTGAASWTDRERSRPLPFYSSSIF
ncbi:hypothetical protein DFQ50_107168 [Pseudocitrobacter faecalis]|uniref:Uncharacterized protein n=1 Tax=Pseudocitrobacter faecalis TaxID=1398493 RepID=A0ABX9FST1_9ENTR|nr:hypothetical protein DFQ50_107168 [Pseudocitrobacter faecalis]